MTTINHKRHRLITKSVEDHTTNINIQPSTTNRMKRKTSLINSDIIHTTTTKKLDIVKSTEFEPRDQNQNIDSYSQIDESTLSLNNDNNNHNHNFDHVENDFDDYADRIFSYLGEAYTKQISSSLPENEINQINSSSQSITPTHTSDNDIKPFLCAFCPYFAHNIQEFQTHIAKHTEKNFRCLLCNCMYKYRRDCVTHMKRKHSNTVNGSISQYIQKINSTTINNNSTQPSSSIPSINPNKSNSFVEPKRYGCPYCSLMTKSTSSIYKHQSRKHATFPKIVHKYSSDDPNTRSLVAILKQKSIKKPILQTIEDEQLIKSQVLDESLNLNDLHDPSNVSSSLSLTHHYTESFPLVNRHRCAASKHITAHNIHSSNGRLSKLFQCCLCGYRARHRSNVVRHVKKIHTIDLNESNQSTELINNQVASELIENITPEYNKQSDENSDKLTINQDDEKTNLNNSHLEERPNYSFNTTVQAPLILNKTTNNNDHSTNSYADIHLSINIFLSKKKQQNSFDRTINDFSSSEDNPNDIYSDENISDDDITKIHITSSHPQNLSNGSLYKPHKCRRCFYRSNWKTDMLHHIRLKHQVNQATKSDYISMDFDTALRTFSDYEKTFGKVLKNRLLLPKIDYIDCTWEELKSKLFINDKQKKINRQGFLSSSSIEQTAIINNNTFSLMNNEEKKSIN
ncbi:unnamed protein product [Rotaria sp. Silwood1]|nr:unnamed protein product [Rotaria sp. Silwood1]CAF1171816.1 unnamed protein product [Rotaria sp. Silwood1]CAF3416233.1 unnamed protein product [Rotaria sp. Silwood1]CAF3466453.1 unnamed protein product [Rotaria sp. Silwood1]CAF3484791.1 unnamed protein product [Rotaria sp. Silwood1]